MQTPKAKCKNYEDTKAQKTKRIKKNQKHQKNKKTKTSKTSKKTKKTMFRDFGLIHINFWEFLNIVFFGSLALSLVVLLVFRARLPARRESAWGRPSVPIKKTSKLHVSVLLAILLHAAISAALFYWYKPLASAVPNAYRSIKMQNYKMCKRNECVRIHIYIYIFIYLLICLFYT